MVRTRDVAAACALVFVAFSVWLIGGWSPPSVVRAIDDIVLIAVGVPGVVFCALAARESGGRQRRGWAAMAVALGAWTVGQAVYSYDQLVLAKPPFPSVADVFFLVFPVASTVAMLLFWHRAGTRSLGRVLLDGLIVAGSLFIVSWVAVMHSVYRAGGVGTREFSVLMAYPAFDLVALTVAATVLVGAPAPQRLSLTLLTTGLALMWLADSAYAYLEAQDAYVSGNLIDIGWVGSILLITVAAAAGRTPVAEQHPYDEVPGWASVLLPYLPLLLAAAVLAAEPSTLRTSTPVLVAGGVVVLTVLLRQLLVVDQNRRLLTAVADQALRDPLTGLANRRMFTERLESVIAGDAAPAGVLVIDLDDFKLVNDTLGHATGDALLQAAARRIEECVGADDLVARVGGDEFAVLVCGRGASAEAVADQVVAAFEAPLHVEGRDMRARPSVGLAEVVPGEDVGAAELITRADMAMYAAKRSPSPHARAFSSDLRDAAAAPPEPDEDAAETVQLLAELRQALGDGDLALVYQPKVDLADGAIVGFEALLRWPHPERGMLGPDTFLPLVRRQGITGPITEFVLTRALDDVRTWRAAGLDLPVAVNLFATTLSVPELPERIEWELASRGLEPSALTVEITEDLVLGDLDLARQVLIRLRESGIAVAVDDFGSGYSALWYLRDLPADEIKLDRNFIAPIVHDARAAAVVHAVIDLARVLSVGTVAEGVEDAATADLVRRYGCDRAQGYYFSAPLELHEVLALGAPDSASPVPAAVAARWS